MCEECVSGGIGEESLLMSVADRVVVQMSKKKAGGGAVRH